MAFSTLRRPQGALFEPSATRSFAASIGLGWAVALTAGCTTTSQEPVRLPEGVESLKTITVVSPDPRSLGLESAGSSVSLGPGSGLTMTKRSGDTIELLFVSDRGPNVDLEAFGFGGSPENPRTGKVFTAPAFEPRFGSLTVDLRAGTAQVLKTQGLTHKGRPVTGIPPKLSGSESREVALDPAGRDLGDDPRGIDPEGISPVGQDTLYIAEEYRPSIFKVNSKTGVVESILEPGNGLPKTLSKRRPNRGFEGLTITPAGAIVAMIQSTLELGTDKQSTKNASLIRGIRIEGNAIRQFALPIDDRFQKKADAKVGDIASIDDSRFLVLVQGKSKTGAIEAYIQLMDTSKSCDPETTTLPDGRSLEFASSLEELVKHCTPATVADLVRLSDLGWKHEKTEGLAIIGNQELLVINDNDFGVAPEAPAEPTEILYIKLSKPFF